jgi:hypothetical protein
MYITSDGIRVSLGPAEAALLRASEVQLTLVASVKSGPQKKRVRFSSAARKTRSELVGKAA